jgi:hypothetical protein
VIQQEEPDCTAGDGSGDDTRPSAAVLPDDSTLVVKAGDACDGRREAFPHVIRTLREINDDLAVDVAADFYRHLRTSTGTLDTGHALHQATHAMRGSYPQTPSLWVGTLTFT